MRISLVIVVLLLLSGCWDTRDINKRYSPAVIGIADGGSEKYRIVLQIPTPDGKTQILESKANSISQGIELIRTDARKASIWCIYDYF